MEKKLIVPARLEKAAKELIGNTRITAGCSLEMIEVMRMATIQKLLRKRADVGCGMTESKYLDGEYKLATCYCLPDDCEIVVQDEKPQVPQWIKDKFTVCEIVNYQSTQFVIRYPDGSKSDVLGLPAALRCEGWVFNGWLHESANGIESSPFAYNKDTNFWLDLSEQQDIDGFKPSTAYASVWQKVGK